MRRVGAGEESSGAVGPQMEAHREGAQVGDRVQVHAVGGVNHAGEADERHLAQCPLERLGPDGAAAAPQFSAGAVVVMGDEAPGVVIGAGGVGADAGEHHHRLGGDGDSEQAREKAERGYAAAK